MPDTSPLELAPDQLRRLCSTEQFTFKDTSEVAARQTIYGQRRGVEAIEFGIAIDSHGYNLYVLGPGGSGRLTAVQHFIHERAASAPTPDDWCYVYNFQEKHKPNAIRLPAGQGKQLAADMEKLIAALRADIARVFESEAYVQARNTIRNRFEEQSQAILENVQHMAAEKSFAIQATPQGMMMITPLVNGQPIDPQAYEALSEEDRDRITARRRELEGTIEGAFRATRQLQTEIQSALQTLRRDSAAQVMDAQMGDVMQKYDIVGGVIQYFQAVRDDILDTLDEFTRTGAEVALAQDGTPQQSPPDADPSAGKRYAVNVLVENTPSSGAPVILLDLPSYQNLVGRIEHEVRFGMLTTDFTHIKSGALHRANGGFLILRVRDLLQHPFSWEALKRALNSRQVVIEDPDTRGMTVMATMTLEPEPIPLHLKVILVGSPNLYYLLHNLEESFPDLFRVKADFDDTMERSAQNEQHYAEFIATRCHQENLRHFDAQAVARVVDYGSWLISDQEKLSTQFNQITPIIYESDFFARSNGHAIVTAADVEQAIAARIYRHNEPEEISQERIARGMIFIDVSGEVVGQVNALTVISLGDYMFGLPSRLTARVFMGRESVVQIDRESELSGPIHDKGVLILQGYLGGRYAQDYPLTITASLTFEQSYGGVEGDSASSAELYALLSALSGFPIRQDIAVTGSVNQRGQVQPIGGATQKVEGFFNTCKTRGLTGTQGVIIPRANIHNLMLNGEVIKAVEAGEFHIYAVETVDEGIALLTGIPADAIHSAVDTRLRHLAEALVEFEERNGRRPG
jgi:lon-related putative ATP-dependent protease